MVDNRYRPIIEGLRYLTTFEWLMKAYDIKADRWSFKLAPQLVGKAQQAYAAMPPDDTKDYAKLKECYSTVEKECLAIKLGIQAFRVYLLGRHFEIETDHRALVLLDRLKDNNARLTR